MNIKLKWVNVKISICIDFSYTQQLFLSLHFFDKKYIAKMKNMWLE